MKSRYFIVFVWAWLAFACFDDKGNYTYKSINELTIEGIDDKAYYEKIAFVDTLKIFPEIDSPFYGDDESRYEYTWKLIPSSANTTTDGDTIDYVIGHDKNLIFPIEELDAGDYRGFFIVSDMENGISWYQNFYLRVKTLTSEGWMVLCDKAGEARMDLIFNVNENEDIIVRDMWQGNGFETGKPERLLYTYHNYGTMRLFVCEKGTYNLGYTDLHVGEDVNFKWDFGPQPDGMKIMASGAVQFNDNTWYMAVVVDDQGDAYARNYGNWGSVFDYPINLLNGVEPFKAAPCVGVTYAYYYNHSVLMYDATNQQFCEIRNNTSYPAVMQFSGEQLFSAQQPGREFVHLESTKNGENFVILREPASGKYYFYGIILNENGKNTQQYYGEIIGDDLDQAKSFACHHLYPYVFYATNNKVYQFDMANPGNAAKEVLAFSGETIQVIKFTAFVSWQAYQDWERARNYQLLVATNEDHEDENSCGIVRMYDVPNLMGNLVQKKEHKKLGKIVDVTYRERDKN